MKEISRNPLAVTVGCTLLVFGVLLAGVVAAEEVDHSGHDHDGTERAGVQTPHISPSGEKHDDDQNEHGDEVHDDPVDRVADDPDDHDDHAVGDTEHDDELELTEAQKRDVGLRVDQAGAGSLHNEFSLMGEVRLNEDRVAHVVPKVSGVAEKVFVSLGGTVRGGQTLAVLQSAELAESKASYLEHLRRLEIAKRTYERKRYLYEEQIVSEADWLEIEAEYQNSETALNTARRKLAVLGLTGEEIEALPHLADDRFGHYELRAPIPGTIIARHITMGEKLSNDSDVFTVADLNTVWIDLNVPARDISRIGPGMEILVESPDGGRATAKIALIGPVIDEETRTALARVVLDDRKGLWKPGMFVTGHVRISAEDLPVVVPVEAVQNIEGEDVVFVPEGHGFKSMPVVTGRRDRANLEIVSGLSPGARYVAHGAFALKSMMMTSSLGSHAGHGH